MTYVHDTFAIDGVRKTADGYIAAFARIARTGIQEYKGFELGRPELDTVRVYRPPEEVFSEDAMRSFAHRPVTLKHPPVPVTAKNWKQYSRGVTGAEVVRDGEFVRVPMLMMDADLVEAYEQGGIKELSGGYSTDLKWEKGTVPVGVTDAGQEYDAVMTAIRGNHLAVVPVARGGDQLRIGDNNNGEVNMKTVIVDGIPVNVADEQTATIIDRAISTLTAKVKSVTDAFEDFQKKAKKDEEEKDKEVTDAKKLVEAKDGEIAVLKKQVEDAKVTPEKLDVMVKDRMTVITKAKTLVDANYVFDGKDVAVIRKDAVTAKLGDSAKTMTDAAIEGAFAALTAEVKATDSAAQIADAVLRRPHSAAQVTDAREDILDARDKEMSEAWKKPAA